MKLLFAEGPSATVRVIAAVILSVLVMGMDHRLHNLEPVRSALAVVTFPLVYIAEAPAAVIHQISEAIAQRDSLLENIEVLRAENNKLRGRMLRFEAMEEENIRLRGQLGAALKLGDRVSMAEISAVDLDPYKHQVSIDKGGLSGVFEGQAVVDARAVMGQIVHVTPFRSTVLMVTDASHALPVRVLRNGLRTIAVGTGQLDRLELPYLLPTSDVRVGD
ncbi:MAG: rod shape-determining protein MreC, partial [Pseudomonadota bacterium]